MNNFFYKFIFLIFLLLQTKFIYSLENKIIFKIGNDSFTSIDYEKRKEYILFVGDNFDLNKSEILDDFINVNLFFKHYINSKNKVNLDNEVNSIFKQIINSKNNSNLKIEPNFEKNIIYNLKLDLIRKKIIESYLEAKKNEIFNLDEGINILYTFNVQYININKDDIFSHRKNLEKIKFKNINEIEKYLKEKNINYYLKEKNIDNIENINTELKKNIISNKNFFIIENNDFLSLVLIKKEFKTYEGLMANILSVKSKNEIPNELLQCDNQEIDAFDLIRKEYEYKKLNDEIKNNLISINDYIKFKNENFYNYIMLCGIKFNKEVLDNFNINKRINKVAQEIENKLFRDFSKNYNLKIVNE